MGKIKGLLGAALLLTAGAAAAQTPRYSSLVVFGDSLVDAGNIRTPPPYQMGRFTNGYDYTDLLSIALYGTPTVASTAGGTNFAFGDARASNYLSATPDLNQQIGFYRTYLTAGHSVDPTGLYVLNFGGNDVFAAEQAPVQTAPFTSASAFLADSAQTYAQGVQQLNDLGARNILITGYPNADAAGIGFATEANADLQADLAALSLAPGTTLYQFSYIDLFQAITADPTAYGLPADLILPDPSNRLGTACIGNPAALPACTQYFSFDSIHPTAAVQQAVFNDLNRQFDLTGTAAVPEPASWATTIAGMVAAGAALRARRRPSAALLAARAG